MPLQIGTILAVAATLVFYLRLIILQRHRAQSPAQVKGQAGILWNVYLLVPGVVLIILGAAVYAVSSLDPAVRSLWWLPVTAGILLMTFAMK